MITYYVGNLATAVVGSLATTYFVQQLTLGSGPTSEIPAITKINEILKRVGIKYDAPINNPHTAFDVGVTLGQWYAEGRLYDYYKRNPTWQERVAGYRDVSAGSGAFAALCRGDILAGSKALVTRNTTLPNTDNPRDYGLFWDAQGNLFRYPVAEYEHPCTEEVKNAIQAVRNNGLEEQIKHVAKNVFFGTVSAVVSLWGLATSCVCGRQSRVITI